MRRILLGVILSSLLLTACSAGSGMENSAADSGQANESVATEAKQSSSRSSANESAEKKTASLEIPQQMRMVIYNANLSVEVKNFETTRTKVEKLVSELNGYIVLSEVHDSENNQKRGRIKIRVPQEHFQSFLTKIEEMSIKVHHREVTGKDVTEEYVDLESRLKSKQVVEERLLDFMKNAKETKDLLQISNDLAKVQEEIEQIKGRMKYLENQTNLSTVNLSIFEDNVKVPELEKELNTWEKTKKQFMNSINFLLSAFSAIVVFLIGNLPVLILLGIIGFIVWYIYRKYKGKTEE